MPHAQDTTDGTPSSSPHTPHHTTPHHTTHARQHEHRAVHLLQRRGQHRGQHKTPHAAQPTASQHVSSACVFVGGTRRRKQHNLMSRFGHVNGYAVCQGQRRACCRSAASQKGNKNVNLWHAILAWNMRYQKKGLFCWALTCCSSGLEGQVRKKDVFVLHLSCCTASSSIEMFIFLKDDIVFFGSVAFSTESCFFSIRRKNIYVEHQGKQRKAQNNHVPAHGKRGNAKQTN